MAVVCSGTITSPEFVTELAADFGVVLWPPPGPGDAIIPGVEYVTESMGRDVTLVFSAVSR